MAVNSFFSSSDSLLQIFGESETDGSRENPKLSDFFSFLVFAGRCYVYIIIDRTEKRSVTDTFSVKRFLANIDDRHERFVDPLGNTVFRHVPEHAVQHRVAFHLEPVARQIHERVRIVR